MTWGSALGATTLGLAGALTVAPAAVAEVAASATLQSDYRYRGFSLSDGHPTVSFSVNYDDPSGAYAGATVVAPVTARDGLQLEGVQAVLGYARRVRPDLSLDLGVSHTDLRLYIRPRYDVRYTEVYAGVGWRSLTAHVYYSPDYLGEGAGALYVEAEAAMHPAAGLRLFGHLGLAAPVDPGPRSEFRRARYDLKAGAATMVGPVELQLAWTHYGPQASYPAWRRQTRDALVAALTYSF